MKPDPERAAWIEKLQKYQQDADQGLRARALRYRDHKPVHHGWLCQVLSDTCEELYGGRNRLIIDGYTISGFMPPFPKARYSAQIMDSSEQAGVGHGIGMAIGAAFGDPETRKHPVIALMGDAGMGNAGFDIETALRFELPIVYVVTNNDGWLTGTTTGKTGTSWVSRTGGTARSSCRTSATRNSPRSSARTTSMSEIRPHCGRPWSGHAGQPKRERRPS